MRVAFLTELFPPSLGGQEVFFAELASALAALGHRVDVYTVAHSDGLSGVETAAHGQVFRWPVAARYTRPRFRVLRRDWSAIVRYATWVAREMDVQRYDFHLLNQWPLAHVLMLSREARACSAIHWCEVRDGVLFGNLQARLPRRVLANFAISESVAAAIERASGRRVAVLPSGIATARYASRPDHERQDVLCLGRLSAHKNIPMLIDAMAIARASGFRGRLIIAGDGPARAEIEAHVQRTGLGGSVGLLGRVDEATKVDLLAKAFALAVPSKREGFPRVVSEAMASGTPVVAADFPENGAADVVRHYGCGVIAGPTAAAMAQSLMGLASGWRRFSSAGLQATRRLDWRVVAQGFEEAVQTLALVKQHGELR